LVDSQIWPNLPRDDWNFCHLGYRQKFLKKHQFTLVIFFVAKTCHFAKKKQVISNILQGIFFRDMVKGTFWKISKKKSPHFEEKKVMKWPRILQNLGKFLAFFF
jgi:hypothetical protein